MKKYITLAIMLSLLDGKVHKAKQLSEKFEASLKTIYRSVDVLLEAGMPISVSLGRNGGFSLIDANKIDSGFFTNNELCSFLSFVGANPEKYKNITNSSLFERIRNSANYQSNQLIEKSQQLIVDTDIWGSSGSFANNQNQLNHAIENTLKVQIEYQGCTQNRVVHPYALVFKTGSWYIYSFCELKNDFRLFKLSRIINLKILPEKFQRKNIDCLSKPWNKPFQNAEKIDVLIEVENSFIPEIHDWLGNNFTIKSESNSCSVISTTSTRTIGLVHRIMQYGDKLKVLSPASLISDIKSECENIYKKYQAS